MKKLCVFILGSFLAASCLPRDMEVPQSPLLSTLERKSGLIAYMGVDGNIYVSDQGGGNLTQLTEDAVIPESQGAPVLYYQSPTWSRDGSQLAFVGLSSDGEQPESKVVVANIDDDSVEEIYNSESEHPIYLNWSPDNENVTFISTNVSGQNMILQSIPAQGGDRTVLDAGSPYYWSWAPDGRAMIVHAGGSTASVPQHLAFLDTASPEVVERAVEATPSAFQAPAWSPDGSRIAFARVADGENQIIVTDGTGENPRTVGTFTEKTAFAWSSDSSRLAYIDGEQALDAGTVGPLHVVDLETSEELVEDGNIIAFFWSPGGEELAYFTLLQLQPEGGSSGESGEDAQSSSQFALDLKVLNVTDGESRELFTYRPTQQFLSILPYFDQYHQSATIWSPDNNNLVLSFLNSEGGPGIAVVAASGNLEPRFLAQGYLAFWSWE
jgi:dipeptidyl aminopeptidase/acylaminoacyl peptidase